MSRQKTSRVRSEMVSALAAVAIVTGWTPVDMTKAVPCWGDADLRTSTALPRQPSCRGAVPSMGPSIVAGGWNRSRFSVLREGKSLRDDTNAGTIMQYLIAFGVLVVWVLSFASAVLRIVLGEGEDRDEPYDDVPRQEPPSKAA